MENNERSSRTAASWFSGRTESALMLRSRAHARGVSKHEGKGIARLILRDGAARLLRMRTSRSVGWARRGTRFAAWAKSHLRHSPSKTGVNALLAHAATISRAILP